METTSTTAVASEKVIRDGKVAIVHTSDHGAGWFTMNKQHQELLYHPKLVEVIESGLQSTITEEWMQANLGFSLTYATRAEIDQSLRKASVASLTVTWLPVGTSFMLYDNDGKEEIITADNLNLTA